MKKFNLPRVKGRKWQKDSTTGNRDTKPVLLTTTLYCLSVNLTELLDLFESQFPQFRMVLRATRLGFYENLERKLDKAINMIPGI